MFHRYPTTFTLFLIKKITKHLFIRQHMVIPFSFTFKSPALHKYASASSLSKSSKFLILQFLVNCFKLHSVSKIVSKSHMLDIVLDIVCTRNVDINYDFIFSKSLNSLNIYINWANMCYPDYQNKKLNCAWSIVSRVFIYASNEPLCGTLIVNLGKNSICACYSKQIKTSFARIKCKISAKKYKRNIKSAIKSEPHWFRGQYYQNFHISMIPTTGKNFKKIHELKVTCPEWFNIELLAWCKSGTRTPGPCNPGPGTPLKV